MCPALKLDRETHHGFRGCPNAKAIQCQKRVPSTRSRLSVSRNLFTVGFEIEIEFEIIMSERVFIDAAEMRKSINYFSSINIQKLFSRICSIEITIPIIIQTLLYCKVWRSLRSLKRFFHSQRGRSTIKAHPCRNRAVAVSLSSR